MFIPVCDMYLLLYYRIFVAYSFAVVCLLLDNKSLLTCAALYPYTTVLRINVSLLFVRKTLQITEEISVRDCKRLKLWSSVTVTQ